MEERTELREELLRDLGALYQLPAFSDLAALLQGEARVLQYLALAPGGGCVPLRAGGGPAALPAPDHGGAELPAAEGLSHPDPLPGGPAEGLRPGDGRPAWLRSQGSMRPSGATLTGC